MKIVCDSCGAKYSIADEKVAGKIFKIRCKKCSSVLEVRGDQADAHPFGGTSAAQDSGGEPTWYIVVDGEQKGPLRPIELSQLFAKGSVGLDSYVWKEGFDDWKAAGDVPELAQVFGGAAAQAKKGTGAEDTSSFGTGGDLFSDRNGREPTSEIDTSSSMFGAFDENPTPTGSQESPLAAAAANDSGASPGIAGLGGGGAGAAAPERMTGQRNENSVLFSLTNLQQLASRGGSPSDAAPAAASRPSASARAQVAAPQAAGEGSGLIDIRALAKSTTPGTKAAPSQAVDDLLSIGTGGSAGLGAPLLGPAPLETSDNSRWLWIGGAAIAVIAIVGAGIGVGMALGGSEDALEITSAEQDPAQPVPGSNDVATAAQAPADPPEHALAVAEPIEAATIEETPTKAAPEIREPAPKKRSSTSSQRRQRSSSRTAAAKPQPAPKKRSSNNLDALMDEVVGGSSTSKPKQATRSSSPSNSNLPDAPSRNDVKKALQGVSGAVKSCRKGSGGTAAVNVAFSGKTGRVSSAKVASGPFKGTPVGACIGSAVKRARVPRFKQSSFKVTFPYRL
jgi:predicted Zn finger-like uncharacterized protein